MNKEQLNKSLHELSPTSDQKQAMLRSIRHAAGEKPAPTGMRWRWISAFAVLVLVIAVWSLPSLERDAVTADSLDMARKQAPESTLSGMNEESEAAPEVAILQSESSFDRELAETPWQPDRTPQALPVFVAGSEDASSPADEVSVTAELSEEDRYRDEIVDYSVYRVVEQSDQAVSLTMTDMVEVIGFEEAKDRLIQSTPDLQQEQIVAGYLSYSLPEETELIYPIYRFRYEIGDQMMESFVDARR